MNKNWLYRILAIALVAMLALPMFAMAEEAAAFELGADGEATAAEQKIGTAWPVDAFSEDAADLDSNNLFLDATYGNCTYNLNVEMATDWLDYQVSTNGTDSLVCKKNSKKAVLTCDKHNHITIKKPGKATLTFNTTSPIDGKTKVTIKLNIKVTDSSTLTLKKESDGKDAGKVWSVALGAPFTTQTFDAPDSNVIAESSVLALKASYKVNSDEDPLTADYDVGEDTPPVGEPVELSFCPITSAEIGGEDKAPEYGRIALYKSSNKSIVAVQPYTGELYAKKVGTATVTCTLYHVNERDDAYAMKTAKVKIKVTKNKSAVNPSMKLALAAAKRDEDIYFGVKQAEYTKVSGSKVKLKVTYFVANGTDNTIKNVWDPTATLSYIRFKTATQNSYGAFLEIFEYPKVAQILVNAEPIATGKKKVNWKAGKLSTFTVTYVMDADEAIIVDLTDANSTLAVTEFSYALRPNDSDKVVWKIAE